MASLLNMISSEFYLFETLEFEWTAQHLLLVSIRKFKSFEWEVI
jgi:hypothetical protein